MLTVVDMVWYARMMHSTVREERPEKASGETNVMLLNSSSLRKSIKSAHTSILLF